MRYILSGLVAMLMLATIASAEFYFKASAIKQADGNWQLTFPLNDGQVDGPAGQTITFGSEVSVCATVYVKDASGNWVQYRKGTERLVTKADWTKSIATALLAEPQGVTEFKIRMYGRAAPGEAQTINGALHLNQGNQKLGISPDPSYTPAGYELTCNVASGKAVPAK